MYAIGGALLRCCPGGDVWEIFVQRHIGSGYIHSTAAPPADNPPPTGDPATGRPHDPRVEVMDCARQSNSLVGTSVASFAAGALVVYLLSSRLRR